MLELGVPAQRSDVQRSVRADLGIRHLRELVDVDEQLGGRESELEQWDQALAAGQHLGFTAAIVQEADRIVERPRRFVAEPGRVHGAIRLSGVDAGSGTAIGNDS